MRRMYCLLAGLVLLAAPAYAVSSQTDIATDLSPDCTFAQLESEILVSERMQILQDAGGRQLSPELDGRLTQIDEILGHHQHKAGSDACKGFLATYHALAEQARDGREVLVIQERCASLEGEIEDHTTKRRQLVAAKGSEAASANFDMSLDDVDQKLSAKLKEHMRAQCIKGAVSFRDDPAGWRIEKCLIAAPQLAEYQAAIIKIEDDFRKYLEDEARGPLQCVPAMMRLACALEDSAIERKTDEKDRKISALQANIAGLKPKMEALGCPML